MNLIRIITFWGLWGIAAATQAQSPALVSSSTDTVNGSSVTIARPAGVAQDDVLIAQITVKGARTVTAPGAAGDWNLVDSTSTAGSDMTQAVFWRRVGAVGAEPASYTFSFSGSDRAIGAISAYSNVDPLGNPLDASGVRSSNGAGSITLPTLTTTQPDTLLVALLGSSRSGNNHDIATGMTAEEYEVNPGAGPNGVTGSLDYQAQASAGSTGAKTAGMSSNTDYVAHLLALRAKPVIAHYAISVLTTTVANCDYAEITITGHDASHAAATPPAGRSLALSTSTGSGAWQAGTVTGTGAWTPSGANNGVATYVWPGGEQSFSVRLRQSAVTTLGINVNDGAAVEDPLEDPAISFVNSALRISSGANTPLAIGPQIAGKPSNVGFGAQSLYLQAVRTDTSTGACVSLFPVNTDAAIEVGAQCNNPAACARNITLSTSALSGNTAVFVPNGAYAATMNFRFTTANAEAPFALSYADAGQVTLQFRAALPAPPAGRYVQGTSNAFIVRPFGLAFRGASAAAAVSHGVDANAALLAAAGDDFTLTLAAYGWASGQDADNDGVPDPGVNLTGNGVTPNFAWSTTVDVDTPGNLAGQPGAISRASGPASVAAGEWSGGAATVSDWRYSEVGNVFLKASASGYLGDAAVDVAGNSGLDGSGLAGGYVGRFRPKHFALSASPAPTLAARSDLACAPASSFTYMDETLQLAFRVVAQNAQNATTQNYAGAYAKLNAASFAAWGFGARSGASDLTARVDPGVAPAGAWNNGVASMSVTTAILRAAPDDPDGPYAALRFGIAPVDSDSTAMDTLDLDVDGAGGNDHRDLGLTSEVRYGRLRLDNALGAEARRLPVPMRVEYWNGTGFATNAEDDCTSIPRSALALDFTPVSGLAACETMVEADPVTFQDGVAALALTAPGAGNSGSVVLTANLGSAAGTYCPAVGGGTAAATSVALPYLLGRWNDGADPDGNAGSAYDDKPSARAAFGLYGSQPGNFIFFRERY